MNAYIRPAGLTLGTVLADTIFCVSENRPQCHLNFSDKSGCF